jgi:deoxyribonuclease-4
MKAGSHISSSRGFEGMGKQAVKLGANTFAFFTRNPRGGKAKSIQPEDVQRYLEIAEQHQITRIVAHAPYTLNSCAADSGILEFARNTMQDDLERMEWIPGNYYNFHPGSHVKQGMQRGIELITETLNQVLKPGYQTTILLETMAGKGTEVGSRFEELQAIIERVALSEKIGVCLDTCHVWDAGYDIVEHLDKVMEEFDQKIGIKRLCAVHVNDSMNPLGSHKDRHARLGEGYIGLEAFRRIVRHEALRDLPFILETPNDDAGWTREIALLRRLQQE